MVDLGEALNHHVTFRLECPDRIYLNGYVPNLQVGGQVVTFLCTRRGAPVPSPALLGKMTRAFVQAVEDYAATEGIPVRRFERGERKEDVARPYLRAAERQGREGVVLIGVAQERSTSFRGSREDRPGAPWFSFRRVSVAVKVFYFYLWDAEFGPAFIKVGTYFPFPARVWLNGHEWLKRQLVRRGIAFAALDNGVASCADPRAAQRIATLLTAAKIERFFRRWVERLPWPLTAADRSAGYRHHLSVLQFEYAATLVFDRPHRARQFTEALIRDHLDLGRPEEVSIVFGRRVNRRTPGRFCTRILTAETRAGLSVTYQDRHRVKEYCKEGRALRIETTINDPSTLGIRKGVAHLGELCALGRAIDRRMLTVQRAAQRCVPVDDGFRRVLLPSPEGQAPGLRFGDFLVLALMAALSSFAHLAFGLTNRSLREQVSALADRDRTARQTSYDLRRLARNGLIERIPRTHRWRVTTEGVRVAALYCKLWDRVVAPAGHALDPGHDCPVPLAKAWRGLHRQIDALLQEADIRRAA